jgi:hypothetical protein
MVRLYRRRDGSLEDPRGTTPLVRRLTAPDLSMGAIDTLAL